MSDARVEDQARLLGQAVEAKQDGWCPGCDKRIIGRRGDVPGEMIVQRDGAWLHEEGTCLEEFALKLKRADARSLRVWSLEAVWKGRSRSGPEAVQASGPEVDLGESVTVVALDDFRRAVREISAPVDSTGAFKDGVMHAKNDLLERLSDEALRDRLREARAA